MLSQLEVPRRSLSSGLGILTFSVFGHGIPTSAVAPRAVIAGRGTVGTQPHRRVVMRLAHKGATPRTLVVYARSLADLAERVDAHLSLTDQHGDWCSADRAGGGAAK